MPNKTEKPKSGKTAKPAKAGGKLRVEQVRSKSGRPALHKRTLIALGLRHHQQVIEINDSPAVRGMLHQVRHLVEVSPAGEK
jgi:large subunit ribosomal protein L30